MAGLSLRNVYKIYDNVKAVNDFSMEIKDKEFIVFVGPSGCGKTTTLRMIAGLEKISAGEIYIDNVLINNMEPKDRDIAMVFQNYALYPHMTVYKNMSFSLRMRKFPKEVTVKKSNKETGQEETETKIKYVKYTKKEIDEIVRNAAKLLEIEEYLDRKPKALSGGQRQRVAIGRAIVRNPKVFLMDEPLSNLDAKLRNQMRAELILLRKRINTTFIYVTHDQTEAMTLGDRIVIMKDGVIQQIGTPNEVFNKPANLFVAGFIGTPQMNFLNARINNEYKIELEDNVLDLPSNKDDFLRGINYQNKDIIIGIRPEHISLCKENEMGAIKGIIIVSECLGSQINLHVDTNTTKGIIIVIQTINLLEGEDIKLQAGNDIWFTWHEKLCHYFDKETEKNIFVTDNK